tara:strand:- start:40 stop:663 length:624 start_codon:yes stop_codon:yes gene_type:complete
MAFRLNPLNIKKGFFGSLATALVLYVIYLQLIPGNEKRALDERLIESEADLHIQHSRITQFDATGEVKYILLSEEIHNFEKSGITKLDLPKMTLYQIDGPPWNIQAKNGEIWHTDSKDKPSEIILLKNKVRVERNYKNGDYLKLKSEELKIHPEHNYAETDRDVNINSHIGEITAAGLKGNIQLGVFNVFSSKSKRVHSILLPENSR